MAARKPRRREKSGGMLAPCTGGVIGRSWGSFGARFGQAAASKRSPRDTEVLQSKVQIKGHLLRFQGLLLLAVVFPLDVMAVPALDFAIRLAGIEFCLLPFRRVAVTSVNGKRLGSERRPRMPPPSPLSRAPRSALRWLFPTDRRFQAWSVRRENPAHRLDRPAQRGQQRVARLFPAVSRRPG